MFNKFLFVFWIILGIVILIAGPTRITYGCVWLCFLAEFGFRIYNDKKNKGE